MSDHVRTGRRAGSRRLGVLALLLLVALLAIAAAGCGGGDEEPAETTAEASPCLTSSNATRIELSFFARAACAG